MSLSWVGLVALTACTLGVSIIPTRAADYPVRPHKARLAMSVLQINRGPNPYCGPRCGRPAAIYVRHRSLEAAYPYTLDPRTKNNGPLYSYGSIRTYVRYVNPRYPDLVFQY